MKTIKFKVKHLLFIGVVAILVIGYGNNIFWKGIELYNRIVPDDFDVNISMIEANTIEGENYRLALPLEEQNYNLYDLVTISDGATSSSTHIQRVSGQKVYNQYLSFGEEENLIVDYPEYVLNVALVQWFSGDIVKTKDIMQYIDTDILDRTSSDHYHLIQVGMALTVHDLDGVMEALSRVEDEEYDAVKNVIKAFISMYFDASVHYKEVDNVFFYDESDRYIRYFEQVASLVETTRYREMHQTSINESNTSVVGRVTRNGELLKGIFIYEDTFKGMSSNEGFDTRVFITDEKGEFHIPKAQKETESLGIIIPWHLIADQQFSHDWELVLEGGKETVLFVFNDGVRFNSIEIVGEDLKYSLDDSQNTGDREYVLKVRNVDPKYDVNGSVAELNTEIRDREGTIDLNEIRRVMYAASNNSSGEVTFERLMEPLYLTGEYYFEVFPVEEENGSGHIYNGLFSDALSYPLEVAGNESSLGDNLIQEGKIEEAIDWYESNHSMHSLKVLITLFSRGYIEKEDVDFQPWEMDGADYEKAAVYTKMLIGGYGKTRMDLSKLARLYKKAGQYDKENDILQEMNLNYPSKYASYDLARNLINSGQYEKGVQMYYVNGEPEVDAIRYYHYFLLGNHQEYLCDAYAEQIARVDLDTFEPLFDLIRRGSYEKAWESLMNYQDSDLKTFYKLMMLESFDTLQINYDLIMEDEMYSTESGRRGDVEYYVSETERINNTSLKLILVMLRKDNNWF